MRGNKYNAVQDNSKIPNPVASFSGIPKCSNPFDNSGDDVNFIEALNTIINAGRTLITHPPQRAPFETAFVWFSIPK